MSNRQEVIGITVDKNTKNLIDKFAKEHALSRSATFRMIVNDFFIKKED